MQLISKFFKTQVAIIRNQWDFAKRITESNKPKPYPYKMAKGYMVVEVGGMLFLAKHKKTIITDKCEYHTENHIMQRLIDDCEVVYEVDVITGPTHSTVAYINEHQVVQKNF